MSCEIWDVLMPSFIKSLCLTFFVYPHVYNIVASVFGFTIFQVASGGNGATTVSATMFFAHKVLSKSIASYCSYLPWFHLITICLSLY
jgi:hypothetical protein